MRLRITVLVSVAAFLALVAVPAHAHSAPSANPQEHNAHHPGTADTTDKATPTTAPSSMMASMMASDAKLDALVKKMNATTGSAKTDAIAELLTALVQQHRTMGGAMMTHMSMMSNMMNMMNGAGGMAGHGSPTPTTPAK